ncbi:MAG: 50S ribosomal protein L4 [Anaerolineales bacterium]|nr:MAG: 50S ribosomal protein L4 [Anaerolineales bacterium]
MQVDLKNIAGETVGEVELRDDIFGIEPNGAVMHQALLRQLANRRLGTHKTKSRGEVIRSKAKWYRQKGTGRARHGSRNAPIFVGGGVAHGPKPRRYVKKMPRKMRQLALRSALSVKAAEERIIVLDTMDFEAPKTRTMVDTLQNLSVDTSAVILLPERNENLERSANNLSAVKTLRAHYLNVRDLLKYDYVILPTGALAVVEEILG